MSKVPQMNLMQVVPGRSDQDDQALLQWWATMKDAGDLSVMFDEEIGIPTFFDRMEEATAVLIGVRDGGVEFGAWLAPFFNGHFFNVWAAPRIRGAKQLLGYFRQASAAGLQIGGPLVGVTRASLVELHEKLGYRRLTDVPGIKVGGELAQIMLYDEQSQREFEERL